MRYRLFNIGYDRHVCFTVNEQVYTRKLMSDSRGYYINFKLDKIRINENELYR